MNDDTVSQPAGGWGHPRPDPLVPDVDADGYPWDIDEDGFHWGTTDGTLYALEHSPIYPVTQPDLYQQPRWYPDLAKDRTADTAAEPIPPRHAVRDMLPDLEAGA